MLYLRSFLFLVGHNITGLLFGLIAVVIWPIFPYSWRWRIVTCWNRFVMLWIYLCCGVKFRVFGQRRIDKYPCVVLAKHQSTWETMFLQYYFGPVSIILKKELLRIPFFGWGLASIHSIAIDRSNPIQALKDVKTKGIERLKEGNNVLVFPEGTRAKDGMLKPFQVGGIATLLKVVPNALIVPIAIENSWKLVQYGAYPLSA
ncbi:MAG: 1-acyl-sn-glycerol-3-phosphate acyltransferase, partial [Moraxellaceae bacterium]